MRVCIRQSQSNSAFIHQIKVKLVLLDQEHTTLNRARIDVVSAWCMNSMQLKHSRGECLISAGRGPSSTYSPPETSMPVSQQQAYYEGRTMTFKFVRDVIAEGVNIHDW